MERIRNLSTRMLPSAFAVLLAGAANAATDLAPISVVGAGTSYTKAPTLVTVNVANFGDPLVGSYTLEVLLSTDAVIDGSDLTVGTLSTSAIGSVNVPVTLPANALTGLLYWGVRLSNVQGETSTANNASIGTQTYVQSLDLELDDPSPIVFSVRPTDVTTLLDEIKVVNNGSAGSVAVFSVETLSPASWLEFDPPSSFAVAGGNGQAVSIRANYEGLEPGTYTTTLHFESYLDANDFIDLPITLVVGKSKFIPGDRLLGQVGTINDKDEMNFDAVKGEKLVLSFKVKAGNLQPRVEVVNPLGDVESTVDFANGAILKKVIKLKLSGEYTLRVIAKDGNSTGSYLIKSSRKLPKTARARVLKIAKPESGPATVEVRLLPGATLDFAMSPGKKFAGPATLSFVNPLGNSLDITNNIQPAAAGHVRVEDVETKMTGSYVIQIAGFGSDPKAKATIRVLPVQPKKGNAKVYIP